VEPVAYPIHRTIEGRPFVNSSHITRRASLPFSAFVALLVALGAQALLDAIVPVILDGVLAAARGTVSIHRVDLDSLWVGSAVVRVLSFAMGGWVAVRLMGNCDRWMLALLVVVSILATGFESFPGKVPGLVAIVLWSLSAPVGMIFGALASRPARKADI
jgi:hypothetical protein